MKMKKQFYFPLLLTLLVSLVFGVFPLGQPATVYAAQDYEYKKPTAFTEPGTLWNLEGQAYDVATPNDDTTAADSVANPGDISPWITFHTWGTKVETYTVTNLFVNWETNGAYTDDTWGIQYTDDGGTSWYDVLAMGVHNETVVTQSSITFATADQDLTLVQVKLNHLQEKGPDGGVTYIYDIWTEGTYTIVAPTVTTQAATSVEATTATGNGTITATGGEDASAWGIVWNTTGNPTTGDNVVAGTGAGGVGAFTASLTGLPTGTTIHTKAYATNTAGTGYGAEEDFLTKPAPPTGVGATDGDHTDKVVITWAKSTGATDYRVYRDAVDSGPLGDVETYDDTGADAPTITPGTAAASDGDFAGYVALSLSGQSANNGTTHTYKVVAVNTTGDSADSSTDTGYRGVGPLTYQWQRSAADSNENYSNIDGANTASYDDTDAPAGGSGRYYKCIENATGASQQTSAEDRGYRAAPVISNSPGSKDFGVLAEGATGETAINFFTVTNTSGYPVNITISGTDLTGGTTWTLSDTATPGTDIYGLKAGLDDDDDLFDIIVKESSPYFLVEGLADSTPQSWGLKIWAPDTFTGGGTNTGMVTLTATAA